MEKINVFISHSNYNHEDKKLTKIFKDKLTNSLKMKNCEYDIYLDDSDVAPNNWRPHILEKARMANIAIFLLSDKFFNSDFCTEIELKYFYDNRHDEEGNDRIILIPLFFEYCEHKDRIEIPMEELSFFNFEKGEEEKNETKRLEPATYKYVKSHNNEDLIAEYHTNLAKFIKSKLEKYQPKQKKRNLAELIKELNEAENTTK